MTEFPLRAMVRAALTAACVAFTSSFAACDGGLSEAESARVRLWQLCEECPADWNDTVAHLGDRAVPMLAEALRGPPPMLRDRMLHVALAGYAPDTTGLSARTLRRDEYAGLMLDNLVARYQKRSASALGKIGTTGALDALRLAADSAAAWGHRGDVRAAVTLAIHDASFDTLAGSLNDSSVRFGDTVRVLSGGPAWGSDDSVSLAGSPFGRDLMIHGPPPDELWFIAAARPGEHRVLITSGPQQDTLIAPLRVTSLRWPPDVPIPVVTPAAPFAPQKHFMSFPASRSDTAQFRFLPSGPLAITADARALGPELPFMRLLDCSGSLPGFGALEVRGQVVDEQGAGISGANVQWDTQGFITPSDGRFAFNVLTPQPVALQIDRMGYRSRALVVQPRLDSLRVNLIAVSASDTAARSEQRWSFRMPARSCRDLQVGMPATGRAQVVRLGLTSP